MGKLTDTALKGAAWVGARRLAAAMTLSVAGAAGIITHEGMVNKVYLDPVGIPTVCAGHIKTVTQADLGKPFTKEQCEELLRSDTSDAQRGVAQAIKVPVTQEQYDALVSFAFNVGNEALRKSTLARKANAGDCWGAGREFHRWNKAGGRILPGLVKRRAAEAAAWESGC